MTIYGRIWAFLILCFLMGGGQCENDIDVLLESAKPENTNPSSFNFNENDEAWDVGRAFPEKLKELIDTMLPDADYYQALLSMDVRLRQREGRKNPKPTKKNLMCGTFVTGGEDRALIGNNMFAVTDGVGGAELDSGPWGEAIGQNFFRGLEYRGTNEPLDNRNNMKSLERWAREAMLVSEVAVDHKPGMSTTLVLGRVDATHNLGVATLGDSQFTVMRRGSSSRFFRAPLITSTNGERFFNSPKQVSSGKKTHLPPQLYSVPIQPGDLIIAATDGLFDNLYDGELELLANRAISPMESAEMMANEEYYATSLSSDSNVPWAGKLPTIDTVSYLKYTTAPETLARALALAARYQSAEGDSPCGYSVAKGIEEDGTKMCRHGKPDNVGVAVCWVA
eukprot:GHVO01052758.1.p1 GENE.GHVO01052758.1~~GHVO01052758.1.p1  ORF type:complete len:394 (-),score=49.46 GHVO01052758.1:145-1326(-)